MRYREDISLHSYIDELVINWHITEACNYKCQYCYAKWSDKCNEKELIHQPKKASKLLMELYDFFHPNNALNPLRQRLTWKTVRLNFAGGEPLLYGEKISTLINQAYELGFRVSFITNGSYLTTEFITSTAPKLSVLGVSLDSNSPTTNKLIGRVDNKGNMLSLNNFSGIIEETRSINPSIKIKVNTVVNKLNFQDDMNCIISKINPDKWKVLQVLPIITDKLSISDENFQYFIKSHQRHKRIMSIEDNHRMQGSYLMIDPLGRFYQNDESLSNEYTYSHPIIDIDANYAFSEIDFSIDKFSNRYCSSKSLQKLS